MPQFASRTIFAIVAVCAPAFAASNAPNAQPNPYHLVENWAQLPAPLAWGQVISVDPLPGGNMLVFQRAEPPLLVFAPSGTLVKSFGDGMFVQPHGLTVDHQGFIWATDAQAKNGKGEQVFKFSPDGKVLMTLGTAGVAGEGPDKFNGPSDVGIAPNGDIFVSDGHVNNRVVKFSKDGKFIKTWGKKGSGPGEFNVPHTLAFDSKGRLFVGDHVADPDRNRQPSEADQLYDFSHDGGRGRHIDRHGYDFGAGAGRRGQRRPRVV